LFSGRWWCWRFQSARSRCLCFAEPFLLFVEVFSDQKGRVFLLRRWFWTRRFPLCLGIFLYHRSSGLDSQFSNGITPR
jgi:hypothetical protein